MQASFPFLAGFRSSSFNLAGQSLETQQSITGDDTVIPTLRGKWSAEVRFVFHGEGQYLQWQAFLAQMGGRLGTTLVPCISRFRPSDRDGHELSFSDPARLAGAQTFEHFGFKNARVTRVSVTSAAALRASEIGITLHDSTGLRPGQFFSIGERLHRVRSHWVQGSGHRITFEPPLRAAVATGAHVEIERPVCKMRMVSETEGSFGQDYADVAPNVACNFAEAI
ncbi:hypothetical protein ACEUZ9_002222 [Paracoccus litorisediminis]|uniref:hypothetical protein n=1 Tax=Paracoccus litorisediminis TaxID=2006130 RepID=UPI003730D517